MLNKIAPLLLNFLLWSQLASTPSSLWWTNCTTEIQDYGSTHLGLDDYFTVFNRRGRGEIFNPDVGLTVGVFQFCNVNGEIGIDYLGGADDPIFFNTKFGIDEDKIFPNAPSFSIGMNNIGTRTTSSGRTNYNIINLCMGKSIPGWFGGTLFLGGYRGSKAIGKDNSGFMIGYARLFKPAVSCEGEKYHKWLLGMDYATGKNIQGGGGVGITYFYSPNFSVSTGPVFFNTNRYNGAWKWTIQFDVNQYLWKEEDNSD